jgi:hypothetical protein
MVFQPLRGAAAHVGARLTLHVPVVGPHSATLTEVRLHATLLADSARPVAPPAPITREGTRFAVASITLSDNAVELRTLISGAAIDERVARMERDQATSFFGVYLIDSGGTQIPIAGGATDVRGRLQRDHVQDEVRIFARHDAGSFRLVVVDGPPGGTPLVTWTVTP